MTQWDVLSSLQPLDIGKPVVVLSGIHSGCWGLFGTGRIQTIRDLKGKTIAIQGVGQGITSCCPACSLTLAGRRNGT